MNWTDGCNRIWRWNAEQGRINKGALNGIAQKGKGMHKTLQDLQDIFPCLWCPCSFPAIEAETPHRTLPWKSHWKRSPICSCSLRRSGILMCLLWIADPLDLRWMTTATICERLSMALQMPEPSQRITMQHFYFCDRKMFDWFLGDFSSCRWRQEFRSCSQFHWRFFKTSKTLAQDCASVNIQVHLIDVKGRIRRFRLFPCLENSFGRHRSDCWRFAGPDLGS